MVEPAVHPLREIRALYTDDTIRVYQAYSRSIAAPAIRAQRFVPPFRTGRMTWIKPSFLWMMDRSGWATKAGQERVLAIDLDRGGFEWALQHACLSHFEPETDNSEEEWQQRKLLSPVRIQWDPERDDSGARLEYRSIQIGLSGEAVERYVTSWIRRITDITDVVARIRDSSGESRRAGVLEITGGERPYPVSAGIARRIGMNLE